MHMIPWPSREDLEKSCHSRTADMPVLEVCLHSCRHRHPSTIIVAGLLVLNSESSLHFDLTTCDCLPGGGFSHNAIRVLNLRSVGAQGRTVIGGQTHLVLTTTRSGSLAQHIASSFRRLFSCKGIDYDAGDVIGKLQVQIWRRLSIGTESTECRCRIGTSTGCSIFRDVLTGRVVRSYSCEIFEFSMERAKSGRDEPSEQRVQEGSTPGHSHHAALA